MAQAKAKIGKILAIDIGATGLKAALVSPSGKLLMQRLRIEMPHPCPPRKMVAVLAKLVRPLTGYDCISIGFPGFVRGGKVFTAPNLGTDDWAGFRLAAAMSKKLGKPARLLNDADMQGLAVVKGRGLELVCTLGTGFGTAVFHDGELLPHMDLAHLVAHKGDDFDDYIGDETCRRIGHKDWNKRLKKLIAMLGNVFFFDHLYLGGGNARLIRFKLPRNVSIVANDAGMEGGAFVWAPRARR